MGGAAHPPKYTYMHIYIYIYIIHGNLMRQAKTWTVIDLLSII